jgi:4-hydroxy-3-methylbut-2-en-1-yl diphosphate reductase
MKVTIDPGSGFCFGVNQAIKTAEDELDAGNVIYSLGEMVHNQVQMDRLKAKGLKVIKHDKLPDLKGEKVLFRAHGEPPETYRLANELGIIVIDATCPIVTKLQQRISNSIKFEKNIDVQIVIYGKPGHAEVKGLTGNAGNSAIIVTRKEDLIRIDFSKPVRLFSQTTMDAEGYIAIGNAIQQRMNDSGNSDLVINKSVCRQVSGRAASLRKFAVEHAVVIFVGGNNSANGAYLFSICKAANEKSFYISNIEDIDFNWFENSETVGVSGATSTPGWLIEQVAQYLKEL